MTTKQVNKPVDILYRVEIKKSGIVVYQVLSSNGVDIYQVSVLRGNVNSCDCPSYKPCRHMRDVQAREDARTQEHDTERTAFNYYELAIGA